ncbi:MAG: GGDEF domain-containing protein [Deltaproteobacteria bacterium]|nr:GGDEF domain-containing protein [Deltaproteobacteria bacterium]
MAAGEKPSRTPGGGPQPLPEILLLSPGGRLRRYEPALRRLACRLWTACSRAEALKTLRQTPVHILVAPMEVSVPAKLRWLKQARQAAPGMQSIIILEQEDLSQTLDHALELVNRGGAGALLRNGFTTRQLSAAVRELWSRIRENGDFSPPPGGETPGREHPWPLPAREPARAMGQLERLEAVRRMLAAENEDLRRRNAVLRIQSTTDHLTGLCNRREFLNRLRVEWGRHRRYHRPLSLIMLDIDNFKKINDTNGHECGDIVLMEISTLIRSHQRDHDLTCRYGGEEFMVLMPETPLIPAFIAAEGLRSLVTTHEFIFRGRKLAVRISLGVCGVMEHKPENEEEFLDMTDKAMYRAKREGRNRTVILDPCNQKNILRINNPG